MQSDMCRMLKIISSTLTQNPVDCASTPSFRMLPMAGGYSGLVVVGYTDGSIPFYERECTSNCTDDVVAVVDGILREDDVDG
jgi:hypothetical protein